MNRTLFATLASLFLFIPPCLAGTTEPAAAPPAAPQQEVSTACVSPAQGLNELLTVGADRAVSAVARRDGYFGNKSISIGVPDELEHIPIYLHDHGYQARVKAFILSLNRTAEISIPKVAAHFYIAIQETAFDDAEKIMSGGATAASDYLRRNASDRLYKALRPAIAASMVSAGVAKAYVEMMEKYDYESVAAFPVDNWSFDLEGHVTAKALDGLFFQLGEEERRIRKEPAARTTALLRQAFGGRE